MPFDGSFAVPDWEQRLRDGRPPMPDLPVNADKAATAVAIFDALRLPDEEGKPKLEDVAGEWFRQIVRYAFAAEDPETGMPLVNEVFCLVPKKNAKTTYSAALGLTALMLWNRPNANLLILGPTQNVSERCFRQAQGMIEADPRLRKIFHVQEHLKTITRRKTGASLQVKTFDLNVVTGEIPALTIIDELHVVAARSYAQRVVAQITGGMITNPRALLVYITTQSDTRPQGVFETKLTYARAVRDGRVTDRVKFLPVLYEFPESVQTDPGQGWRDPALWPMVLPNLHRSVKLELLQDKFATAVEEGIDSLIVWASQHLNVQVGMGLHNDRWVGADFWMQAADPALDLDALIARSEVCVVGIDGGGLDDLLGLAVLGRDRETKDWLHWGRAWADPIVKERRKAIAARLDGFAADGDLVWCENGSDDLAEVAEICGRLNEAGLLPERNAVGLDPEGVAAIVDALIEAGLAEEQLAAISQGYKLNAAIQGTPRKLKNRTLRHGGRPLMAWTVENAKTERRGNAVVVTKAVSGAGKIDPLMALFDAVQLMSWNPVAAGGGITPWDADPEWRLSA